jgi:arginase
MSLIAAPGGKETFELGLAVVLDQVEPKSSRSRGRVRCRAVEVCVVEVPFHAGDERHPSSRGPQQVVEAGAADLFAERGVAVTIERAGRETAFRDTASSSAQVNRQVATIVRRAVADGRLPIILAGSCNACLGALAGFEHGRCGAVWLDAHADFNTPDSTSSGFFAGMSAAVVTGHCYEGYWGQIGDNTPLAEDAIAMFGVRDLSPSAERQRLQNSAIHVVHWRDGQPDCEPLTALDEVARRARDVYLHIDFDAFAPEVAPGIADEPVPGGLTLEQGESIVRTTTERFRIQAATLATYTPERDHEERTLRLALSLIELLAYYASDAERRPSPGSP